MGRVGIQMWTWALLVSLSWMYMGQASSEPQYLVPIPAILESGAEAKFCVSLLQPNESLLMTITLRFKEVNLVLLEKRSEQEFHHCFTFQVALVEKDEVWDFEVEVRGNTFWSKEVRKVKIVVSQPVTFIQTDKPIYLPGQTVHFRVVTLDTHLRPACRHYDKIHLEDSNNNLIGQWLNETSHSKILQLSYELNPEAREGTYSIIVIYGEDKLYHNFKVEKYVLPKFEVKINASDEVNINQAKVTVEVCAEYTFGQPVPGTMKINVCRPFQRYYLRYSSDGQDISAPCYNEYQQTDIRGCVTFTFSMSVFTTLDKKILQDFLDVTARMEEEGTGIEHSQNKRIDISYVIGKLTFFDTPKIYEKGTYLYGKIRAVDFNDAPIPYLPVYLFEGERWSSRHLQNLTTDANGVATFTLETSQYSGDIHLHVSNLPTLSLYQYRVPYFEIGEITLSMAQESSLDTNTVSYLKVQKVDNPLQCYTEVDISIQYTVVKESQGLMTLIYLVISRDGIFLQGSVTVVLPGHLVTEDSVSFKLYVDSRLVPGFQVLTYAVLPSGFVIAHKADFSTEKCFSHKVLLQFSPSSALPGEQNTLVVSSQPNSLCGISAVDQSVLIKEPGKTLNADKIYDLLPRRGFIPYDAQDAVECLPVRPKRYVLPYPPGEDDAFTVFQNLGLKMATNLMIQVPTCLKFMGRDYHQGYRYNNYPPVARMETVAMAGPVSGVGGSGRFGDAEPPIETVRTFFPETWIWDLVEVGESGSQEVSLTVPDTITTWETEAFCLSTRGFGLAPRVEFTVFQPFFLELTLPYSIVRGERFELKATIFNYLSNCFMVAVSIEPSTDYILTAVSEDQCSSCLCGRERKTIRWIMEPSALGVVEVTVTVEAKSHVSCGNDVLPERGRIDTVTKSVIVKPEGVEKTDTYSWLLCPDGKSLTEEAIIVLPRNVIEGSVRVAVSVLGDILGRALQNLDGLLQMPYGCGEQNMVKLAPNIYILQYLKNTNQLTSAIREKATRFLTSGYQRQLNYKHDDGGYSTFGSGTPNTWLTAFVLRTFAKGQSYVFIDPSKIEESQRWLESKQQENGCFEQSGKLFNNRIKGGVSDEVTLTAYITAAFLEMNIKPDHPVVNRSLSCLKESLCHLSNTYTSALLAYVFTLAGDMETQAKLLDELHQVANKDGGFLYWSQTSAETSASLSVEISSYVLLAKLSASPSAEDLGYAASIVRWLTTQQNNYGGFSSTQDTVVALQALALYSTLVYNPGGSSAVKVESSSGQEIFEVNQDNKLVYQERALQYGTGKFTLKLKGTACVAIQISAHYNIPATKGDKILNVEVETEADCDASSQRPKMTLKIKSLYRGTDSSNSSNMAILDIKVISGFALSSYSLSELQNSLLVDRVEKKDNRVLVYLEELPKDIVINHKLVLIQELPVWRLKPGVVRLYDYYQPSEADEAEYAYPCASD